MLENRNTILAVILSGLVLIAWQYFYNIPQMEKQRATQQQAELQKAQQQQQAQTPNASSASPVNSISTRSQALVWCFFSFRRGSGPISTSRPFRM